MRKTICDRCDAEISEKDWLKLFTQDHSDSLDLCDKCAADFASWLNQEKDEQPQEEPERKTKNPRYIDRGKVKALRDAGWTVPKIADELKCSKQGVYAVLAECGVQLSNKKKAAPE